MFMRLAAIFLFFTCLNPSISSQSVEIVSVSNVESAVHFFLPKFAYNISNISWIGNNEQMGGFISSNDRLGHPRGLLLSSGHVSEAVAGPNVWPDAGHSWGDTTVLEGERQLSPQRLWFDAVGLEFDFVPLVEELPLRVVFGSEEYCRFSERGFDDFAAVYLSGPGIDGVQNLLEVSEGKTLSVHTVNAAQNTDFYQNNPPLGYSDCGDQNADLFETTGLNGIAEVPITPFFLQVDSTYHMKIVLSDAGDGLYDSALLLSNNVLGPPVRAEECISQEGIYVFPSLAESSVQVFSHDASEAKRLYIFDNLGKLIVDTELPNAVYSVDVSNYSAGLYVFQVVSGLKKVACKVIKI